MKCLIPSFVADFVSVQSWISNDGTAFFPGNDFGNFRISYGFLFIILVVPQTYWSNVHEEFVLAGNSGILKCIIPSFVADFVSVQSWISNDGTAYFPGTDFGNCHLVYCFSGPTVLQSCSS